MRNALECAKHLTPNAMATADAEVLPILERVLKGKPEFYLYMVDNPPLWLRLLLAGGLLAAFLQKPYMVAYAKGTFHFVPASPWTTTTLREEGAWSLAKSEIVEAKLTKFGPARTYHLTLKNGRKMHLVANTLYKKLEKHKEAMSKMAEVLGV